VIFRVGMLICGTVLLAFALDFALAGIYGRALSVGLVGAGALVTFRWGRRSRTAYPVLEWVSLGLVAAGLVVGGHVILAVTLFPAVSALLLLAAMNEQLLRRAEAIEIEQVARDELMPGAQPAVAALEANGFSRAGGYAALVPRRRGTKRVVGTVLIPPAADRLAVVTDRVVEVASRFEGERWLLTTNRGDDVLPDDTLRQLVPVDDPAELVRVHQAAIERLSSRGTRPERFPDDIGAIEAAIHQERRALRFVIDARRRQNFRIRRAKISDPALGDDETTRKRIDAWLDGS
jgi:hypothetical protein